jgi:hypothetical protein
MLQVGTADASCFNGGNPNARTSVFKVASPSGEGNPHQVLAPSGFTVPYGGKTPHAGWFTATHWLPNALALLKKEEFEKVISPLERQG